MLIDWWWVKRSLLLLIVVLVLLTDTALLLPSMSFICCFLVSHNSATMMAVMCMWCGRSSDIPVWGVPCTRVISLCLMTWRPCGPKYTHTCLTAALCLGLHRWVGTRTVRPVWILLKQETLSGSGISWAICKSAPCSRQITTPAPHHSIFYRPDACHPTNSVEAYNLENMLWIWMQRWLPQFLPLTPTRSFAVWPC